MSDREAKRPAEKRVLKIGIGWNLNSKTADRHFGDCDFVVTNAEAWKRPKFGRAEVLSGNKAVRESGVAVVSAKDESWLDFLQGAPDPARIVVLQNWTGWKSSDTRNCVYHCAPGRYVKVTVTSQYGVPPEVAEVVYAEGSLPSPSGEAFLPSMPEVEVDAEAVALDEQDALAEHD